MLARSSPLQGRTVLSRGTVCLALVAIFMAGTVGLWWIPSEKVKRARQFVKRQVLILTGGLVDVGGYRLRIECHGTGSPTVVMDSGLDMTRDTWGRVPHDVATFTRTCIYERAGVGESDGATPTPRTSELIVRDLHTLLRNAGEREPFLLVGHSFGGLNARLYASRYPRSIAGLVLVDSSHEEQYERYAALKPPGEREKYLRHEGGANHERVDLLSSAAEVRGAPGLPQVPIVILSARPDRLSPQEKREIQVHYEMQAALTRLVSDSKLVFVDKSGHFIQQDHPQVVVETIRELYERTRK